MLFFFIFVIGVVAIFSVNNKKKNKGPVNTNNRAKRRTDNVITVPKPTRAALDLAARHFGPEWDKFLGLQPRRIKLANPKIREMIASGYLRLGTDRLEELLLSFQQINSSTGSGATRGHTSSDLNYYKPLHQATHDLIKNGSFNHPSILKMLNKLIETAAAMKKPALPEPLSKIIPKPEPLKPVPIPVPVRNTVPEPVRHIPVPHPIPLPRLPEKLIPRPPLPVGKEQRVPVKDESIIEVSQEPHRIHYDQETVPQIQQQEAVNYADDDPDTYSLGVIYKERLNLSAQETDWLNKFYNYGNVFNSIEGAELEIIKFYLLSLKLLTKKLKHENSSIASEVELLKVKTIAFDKSQPTVWEGYHSDYNTNAVEANFFLFIYKKAESVIREAWGHKRKITAEFYSRSSEVKSLFEERLEPKIQEIAEYLTPTVSAPDEVTEIALNESGSTRWKLQFDRLTAGYTSTHQPAFIQAIHLLARLNEKNPNVEHIYYEASKFMVSYDKLESLKFYLYYIWYDLKSVVVDNKQFNKTIQKKLFANPAQLEAFQNIINELVRTRLLKRALVAVEDIYKVKRKNITLDQNAIQRVQLQHSGTVAVLSELLNDDDELYELRQLTPAVVITTATVAVPGTDATVALSEIQLGCLQLFAQQGYRLSNAELEDYAKSNAVFKNQLIDGINESCYEILDDVLIEEEEDGYEINPEYFKQIIS